MYSVIVHSMRYVPRQHIHLECPECVFPCVWGCVRRDSLRICFFFSVFLTNSFQKLCVQRMPHNKHTQFEINGGGTHIGCIVCADAACAVQYPANTKKDSLQANYFSSLTREQEKRLLISSAMCVDWACWSRETAASMCGSSLRVLHIFFAHKHFVGEPLNEKKEVQKPSTAE